MAALPPAELLAEAVSHPRTDWGGSYPVCAADPLLLAETGKRGLDNMLDLKPLRGDPDGVCIPSLSG